MLIFRLIMIKEVMLYLLKKKKYRGNQGESINLEYEDFKKELETLRKYLDYKNSGFCKRKLDGIIEKYFDDRE